MKIDKQYSRRDFVQFIGGISASALLPVGSLKALARPHGQIKAMQPSSKDALLLAGGLDYEVLISWGETINAQGQKFGFNNDYLDFVTIDNNPDDCLLWVNHESIAPGYFPTPARPEQKSRADVEMEMREVGGSILRMQRHQGKWHIVKDDALNRRIDALTPIPLIATGPIVGSKTAQGTLSNCAGGHTPWQTFLSCEENYHYYVGEVDLSGAGRSICFPSKAVGWNRFFNMPPEHYGWVVEIDPLSATAKKHTSMGRFAHESATVVVAQDGRCVVYSGDDKANECIYKFIADKPGTLETGTLYVADTDNGKWLPLAVDKDRKLKSHFASQLDLLIRTREAARLVGGTPQDRPEDIERDPRSGAIFVTLTKNKQQLRFGAILKIEEDRNDPLALNFKASTFLTGGEQTGFACPDNLAFDKQGNLWFTSDISTGSLNKPPYAAFKNNGLFFVPMSGPNAGRVFQMGSAPVQAEFTGICFSADGRELFVSVQHPGENSKDKNNFTSHWPDGGKAMPRPSVVVISGAFLKQHSAAKRA